MRSKIQLNIDASLLTPGLRLAVGLSGGADSVALLRALHERAGELGLVLSAAHLHHGLRGEEADADLEFCRSLASELGIPFFSKQVDTAAEAAARKQSGGRQSIEEAARHLRYAWFRELMSRQLMAGSAARGEADRKLEHTARPFQQVRETPPHAGLDAIATAHTLDDQAETVLAKFLRGAWTEGLSGIHPELRFAEGRIVRPLLKTTRADVEAYLKKIGQAWREDSTNRQLTFTRNRIRHELLPLLETWNPRLREHMAAMAELARDEEAWWQSEVEKLAPQLLLPGRAVRGGGRAAGEGTSFSIDVKRLAALPAAMQRRLLRSAAERLGTAPDFEATEAVRAMALNGRAGQKLELEGGLRAERTPRELRIAAGSAAGSETPAGLTVLIPGEVVAPEFGLRLRIERGVSENGTPADARTATLRIWRAGDRVTLRYSSGPRKVKEVLERLKVTGSERAVWPVLESPPPPGKEESW